MNHESKENAHKTAHKPTIAPGMEMDELDEPATEEEIEQHDSTSVTQLIIDRTE